MSTRTHPTLWLALAACAAILAGCASDPIEPQKVTDSRSPCSGVAPATGTMLRKKDDCSNDKRQMTQEEIDEFRRTTITTKPPVGKGLGQ